MTHNDQWQYVTSDSGDLKRRIALHFLVEKELSNN